MFRVAKVLIIGLFLLNLLTPEARAERRIYYIRYENDLTITFKRANLDGAAHETFLSGPIGVFTPVAVEAIFTRQVFYSDNGLIHRVSVDGGASSLFINTGSLDVYGLALDTGVNGPLYFARWLVDGSGSDIWRTNLDGTGVTFILATPRTIWDLALDPIGNKLYWLDTDGTIHRANQTGTSPEAIVFDPGAVSIAVDGLSGFIYWTNSNFDDISRTALDGSGFTTILSALADPFGIKLDFLGKLYFYEGGSNRIKRANVNGTGLETIAEVGGSGSFDLGLELGFFSCGRTTPFGDVNNSGVVNFTDVSITLDCFRGAPSCTNMLFNRADLNPCNSSGCVGDGVINFSDVSKALNAFRGVGC